jgi:hypothetical protein
MEVDVRQASEDVRQLGGKGGVVALVAVPLAEDCAAGAAGERGYHDVVGVGVVERLAEEAKADTRVRPTWGRGVDVGGQQVVTRVGGLRARKIEASDSDDEPQCRLLLIQEERRVALGRRGVRWHLLGALEPRHEHVPDTEEGVVVRRCAVIIQAKNGTGEVGVIRLGPTEVVVGAEEGIAGLVRAVEKVLQPAASAHVTDEDVQLPVWSELDHSAVVIAATGCRRGFALEGWLKRPQPDDVLVRRQRRSVPDEPIHPVAQ